LSAGRHSQCTWSNRRAQSPTRGRAHTSHPPGTAPCSSGRRPLGSRPPKRPAAATGAAAKRVPAQEVQEQGTRNIWRQDSPFCTHCRPSCRSWLRRPSSPSACGTELGTLCLQHSPGRRCPTCCMTCTLCSLQTRHPCSCFPRPPRGSRSDRSNCPTRLKLGAWLAEEVVGMGRAGASRWQCSYRLAQ
jgi:hypothetical protein